MMKSKKKSREPVDDTPPKLLSHRAALLADDFLRQLKVRMPQ